MPSARPEGSTTLTASPGAAPPASRRSLEKIQGCPEATRAAALRLILASRMRGALLALHQFAGGGKFGIPSAAQSLNEEHAGDHAAGEQVDRGALFLQGGGLGGDDLEIGDGAGFVLVGGN